jgi:hypothetical protein
MNWKKKLRGQRAAQVLSRGRSKSSETKFSSSYTCKTKSYLATTIVQQVEKAPPTKL